MTATCREEGRFIIRIPLINAGKRAASDEPIVEDRHDPKERRGNKTKKDNDDGKAVQSGCKDDWCMMTPDTGESSPGPQGMPRAERAPLREGDPNGRDLERDDVVIRSNSTLANDPEKAISIEVILPTVEYAPFQPLFRHKKGLIGAKFSVRIKSEYFKKESNRAMRAQSFYGGEKGIYTDDSDVVCILIHQGAVQEERLSRIKAVFEVLSQAESYPSIEANGMKSRPWTRHTGYSIRLVEVKACKQRCLRKGAKSIRTGHYDCPIRFSSFTLNPIYPFALLLFDLDWLLNSFQTHHLSLEGTTSRYRLSQEEEHFVLNKEGASIFPALKWTDIHWLSGGIKINSTFINLHGYQLLPKGGQ